MKAEDIFESFKPKVELVTIAGLTEPLEVTELNVGARLSLTSIDDLPLKLATIVRYGVPAMREISEQEIIDRLPFDAVIAMSDAVMNVSGLKDDDEKKSLEATRIESLRTG